MRTSTAVLLLAFALLLVPEGSPKYSPVDSHRSWIGVPAADAAAPRRVQRGTPAYRAWIIRRVFPDRYQETAVRVARCESGLSPFARNGKYRGLFQVSPGLRRDYRGFGRGGWRQAKHALRVFNASGQNWMTHWRWSAHCWAK